MYVYSLCKYIFTISSTSAIEVTLYDSNFNKINISPTSLNSGSTKEFSHILSVGTYFFKSNYSSETASGTITVSIVEDTHTHSYTMKYYNFKWHRLTCDCGQTTGSNQVHAVLQSEIVSGRYATCVGCNHVLDLKFDMALIGGMNSVPITQVSINGSYILSNGLIVLVDVDFEAYLNGTLVFYNKDEIPLVQ